MNGASKVIKRNAYLAYYEFRLTLVEALLSKLSGNVPEVSLLCNLSRFIFPVFFSVGHYFCSIKAATHPIRTRFNFDKLADRQINVCRDRSVYRVLQLNMLLM